jgi:hypothetical protein
VRGCRAYALPSGSVSSPVKVPVTLVTTVIQSPLSELDRVRGVHADVRKHPSELLHRGAVRVPP